MIQILINTKYMNEGARAEEEIAFIKGIKQSIYIIKNMK